MSVPFFLEIEFLFLRKCFISDLTLVNMPVSILRDASTQRSFILQLLHGGLLHYPKLILNEARGDPNSALKTNKYAYVLLDL